MCPASSFSQANIGSSHTPLPLRLEGPPTTPKFDMNAPSVGLSFAVPDRVLLGYEPELFGQFPGRKTSENARRFPEAQGSGVGEGCSKALADLKAGSTGPDRLLVGHLFTSVLPLRRKTAERAIRDR